MTFLQRHAYSIGGAIAAAAWPFFFRRRRISVDNVLKCGITSDPREARRIARVAWCHFAGHIAEALFVPRVVTRENWREHLDFSGAPEEAVKLLLDTPEKPVLLVSGHHGVWEAATNILSFSRPMIAIARKFNSAWAQKFVEKHHFRGPVTLVDKNHGFTSAVLRQWKEECAALTVLMDQHAWNGERLEFLGRPAMTVTSAARLAVRSGCPVVIGSFVRIAPYRYRLVGGTPLEFSRGDDVRRVTQIFNDRLGEAIRQYPEQYLWSHRRWRED